MKWEYKTVLKLNEQYLVEVLEIEPIVQVCFKNCALMLVDEERITSERSRPDQVIKFLKILMTKDDGAYTIFLDALCHESVDQRFIRELLEKTEVTGKSSEEEADMERCLEEAVRSCFKVKKDTDCHVDEVVKVIRVYFRRQKACLEVRAPVIYNLIRCIFPEMSFKKNKRKNIVAIKNCEVNPQVIMGMDDEDDGEDYGASNMTVTLDTVTPSQVAAVMKVQLEKEGQDINMADRMKAEDICGKSLNQLTKKDLHEMFPDLTLGKRIRIMDAVKSAIEELKKAPEIQIRERKPRTPRKLETFRAFDTRSRATDVYGEGYQLPEEQSRPGYLLEPLHKFCMIPNGSLTTLAAEAIKFAAACMNERVDGTIHFGVVGKYESGSVHQAGRVVGLPINKREFEMAITEEIYQAFFDDQRETALKCIRDPVYIPVVDTDSASAELYVVEVDIVPCSGLVGDEAFFLQAQARKDPIVFRYIDGTPKEVDKKELYEFMDAKKNRTDQRREAEKDARSQPASKPELHQKLHRLLTAENDYSDTDIFPILFLSPLPTDITGKYLEENFHCIKSLKPLSVFDFNPLSFPPSEENNNLYSVMENQFSEVYEALTTDNFDKNSEENEGNSDTDINKLLEHHSVSSFRPWIFCNGYWPLEKEELKPATWRSQRALGFKEAVRFYREHIPADRARIIIFLFSRNYDVLLGALEEIFVKFPDQWILVTETEKVAKDLLVEVVRRSYVEKAVLEDRCVIGMPWSHVNSSITNIFGFTLGTGCALPSSTGALCLMKERDRNGLPDLEVLSISQCAEEDFVTEGNEKEMEKKKRQSEEDFYRGKTVSWWNFFFQDHVLRRSQFDDFKDTVEKKLDGNIPDDEKVAVVTIYHQPGAGGSTTARQILWEMRKDFRCCVVKQIPDSRQICDQIAKLRIFEEPESPKPPLVLIDNEDEEKVFQLCSHVSEKARREARDYQGKPKVFCVLIVCVRMTDLPKRKRDGKADLMLGHELQTDEVEWFKTKSKILEEKYERKQLGLHPKLLISFNILKENFKEGYIKGVVEEFVSKIKDFKEKRMLKFIALINTFDPDFQLIPMSCFNMIMCPERAKPAKAQLGQKVISRGEKHWETSLSSSLNVLLNRSSKLCLGGGTKAVRIINNPLSREILNYLCQESEQRVSDVILEFLNTDIFKKCNSSIVQTQLIKIMKDILKKRAPYQKGREKFSPIILQIGRDEDYDTAAEVLQVGLEKFDDPMIAQQIARIYIHTENWKLADTFARTAQDMKPKNSYLCDTHGQVYKQQLITRWKKYLDNEEQIEGQEAIEVIDMAFKAIKIFRREQKLSVEDCWTGYNNCGFVSELCVIVALLDCCRLLNAFKDDKKKMHKFLVQDQYVPPGLTEELGEERIELMKGLYHDYEKPMRRLEDEHIQLKEDSCYQYSPSYTNSLRERRTFVHLQESLDIYFGEDSDKVPTHLSESEACEYRRRRVRRKGGRSLNSIFDLRDENTARKTLQGLRDMIEVNVNSQFCKTFDLKTVLNVTLAQVSNDRKCGSDALLERAIGWSQQLYEKSKQEPSPHLEAFLYLVMFNWPTEWRNQKGFHMIPCSKIQEVVRDWKKAFQNNHPAQKEEEGKTPDRRKGTTLFFLGQGEGFGEIVFYSQLKSLKLRHLDELWDTAIAKEHLKHLKGTLLRGGKELSVTIYSPKGSGVSLQIPTSYPIRDHSMWQKSVGFVLGFCWSGLKAYSISREGKTVDRESVHPPLSFDASKLSCAFENSQQQKPMPQHAGIDFWPSLSRNKDELEQVEEKLRLCPSMRSQLLKQKKRLETDRENLLHMRTSMLVGPDN